MNTLYFTSNAHHWSIELAKAVIIAIASVAALIMLFVVILYYDLCSEELYSTTNSPAHEFKVVVREKNCGATTSYNYIVHVGTIDQSYFLTKAGWVYGAILDDSRYGVTVTWLSDTHAEVRFKDARRYKIIESPVIIAGKSVTVTFADESAP